MSDDASTPNVVVVTPTKSVGISIILTVLFGPLGVFYSSIWGGVIMTIITVGVGIFTFGFGAIVPWLISILWGALAVKSYNEKLIASSETS